MMTVRRSWLRVVGIGVGVCVLSFGSSLGTSETVALVQDKAAASEEAFEKGRQLMQRHEYFEAYKIFKRANELAGGRSAECFLAMARALHALKLYTNAVESSQTAIEIAQNDPRLQARGHSVKGLALQSLAEADRTKLAAAEAEFRLALSVDPESKVPDLHFNLGFVLMRAGRDEEGIAEMKRELDLRSNGTTADQARALILNPRRARESYASDFAVVSSEGQHITLESLRGKVVLLDFWGTWCGPCVRAVPSLRKFQKLHAADPFVILGISSDKDEMGWHAFIVKNGMVWPQYWDGTHELQSSYGVHVFPTYVVIDAEGIERFRTSETGFDRNDALGKAIEKQLTSLRPSPRSPADPHAR